MAVIRHNTYNVNRNRVITAIIDRTTLSRQIATRMFSSLEKHMLDKLSLELLYETYGLSDDKKMNHNELLQLFHCDSCSDYSTDCYAKADGLVDELRKIIQNNDRLICGIVKFTSSGKLTDSRLTLVLKIHNKKLNIADRNVLIALCNRCYSY